VSWQKANVHGEEPLIQKEVIYSYCSQLGKDVMPTPRGLPFSGVTSQMLWAKQKPKELKQALKQLDKAKAVFVNLQQHAGPTYYVRHMYPTTLVNSTFLTWVCLP
jgi:hypothetical protein